MCHVSCVYAMSVSAVQFAGLTVAEPAPPFHQASERGPKNVLIHIAGPAQQLAQARARAHEMGPPKTRIHITGPAQQLAQV
jgi:hypothetical protein